METIVYGNVQGAGLVAEIASQISGLKHPVVISIHGGRRFFGTRKDTGAIDVEQWVIFGYFAMSIDCRMVTNAPATASHQEVPCVIRWVHVNAVKYNSRS